MKYEIAIKVDTNDADYYTEVSEIDSDELQLIKPLIEAIRVWTEENRENWNDHNYSTHEYGHSSQPPRERYEFPEEVHEFFEDLCGHPGEHGFHTIESITITPAVQKTVLL